MVNVTTFLPWDGDAAVAAQASAGRIAIDLEADATSSGAIARAAKAAAYDIENVKSRLRQIRGQLDNGITIDNATATVLPPPDLRKCVPLPTSPG